ncbi:MAG: TonB-dependent receptor [Erythrobacter sp.]|uniref:TonB-dependent receptor n=1 Tax=Erythrobacter sp. TaxID=1042 RepID=UPI0032F08E74
MSQYKTRLRAGLAVGAICLVLPAVAQAQDASDGGAEATSDQGLRQIVVTAQRRAEAQQDVPIAITAFDQAEVERFNARDISELAGQVPNLVLTEVNIGPSLAQVSIRGVNSQDPEKSFDPAVGTFLDGIYLGTSAFNLLDTFDLERIEVLRGPQGTLFGRNTTGGALNATRRRPTGEFGARGVVTVGNFDTLDFRGEINTPLIGDTVSLLVRGQYLTDDGFFANPAGGSRGARDRWNFGTVLRIETPGVATFDIIYDHAEDNSDLAPYVPRGIAGTEPLPIDLIQTTFPVPATVTPAFGPDPLCLIQGICDDPVNPVSTSTDPHFLDARLDALTVTGDIYLSDTLTLSTVFGMRDSREEVFIDFDGSSATAFNVVREQDYSQYSGEIRLASSFEGPINFVAGAFHFHSEYSLRQAIKLDLSVVGAPVPPGVLFVNGAGDEDDHESTTTAIFAQADWAVTDTLTLTLGGRATWDEKSIETRFYDAGLPPTAPYQITDGIPDGRPLTDAGGASEDWFEFTPKVMLTWEPDADMLYYASFTRGYNAGGFSARAGTVRDVTTPFDPEIIDAFEVGGKLDLLDRRLRINAALFWNEYKDKQEEAIEPGPPPTFTSTTVRNVAEARIRGAELEVSALPFEGLRIDASLGYLDAEYTDYEAFIASSTYISTPPQPPGTLILADLSTLELRNAPEWTGSIGATYTADLGFGELQLNGQGRYVGERVQEFFNSPRGIVEGLWRVDSSATISFGGPDQDMFRVTAFVENLFDEQINFGLTNSIVDFGTLSPPRLYGVEIGFAF